jgi:surface antigen
MSASKSAVIVVLGLALGACAGSGDPYGPGPKENTGTVLGALGGAIIGSQIGTGTTAHVAGALVGAGLGALIGNRIGAAMDDEDKRRAYAAQMQALDAGAPGASISWRNPDSGRYGMVVPGPTYEEQGRQCRSYTHTIYIDGKPETARGTACRNPDGSWTPLS